MDATTALVDAGVVIGLVATAAALIHVDRRSPRLWSATVTPLGSIIGSGFLVVTPLLAATVGPWAPLAMAGIVATAWAVGGVIRFVIVNVEPRLADPTCGRALADLERLSRLVLGAAYVVSVAFYLRLMAAFVLRPFEVGDTGARILTTVVLVAIGAVGWLRGLHGLELVERWAVGTKLTIVGGLLVSLAVLDASDPAAVVEAYRAPAPGLDAWTLTRVLAGMLLVVQGFETSRYLDFHYDADLRVRSMRLAQALSAVVYVAFVGLGVRTFGDLPAGLDETAIIDLARDVSVVLVPLLVVAAVASQLSAGIADTAGGGEMITGARRGHPDAGVGYVVVVGGAIVLTWLSDVFAIISLASRAFALYYLLQTIAALVVAATSPSLPRRYPRLVGLALVALLMAFVVGFARPAGA
ncbi:MAG: hypothetical protein D6683_01205 [Actinomyces sp.]|nr:MAG: hypothetical protein D6683_01205 [Actinomyces sp.]